MTSSEPELTLQERFKQMQVENTNQLLKSKSEQIITQNNFFPFSPKFKKQAHSEDYVAQVKALMDKKRKTNKNNEHDNSSNFIFNPPDWRWQKNKAVELGLPVDQFLWKKQAPWHVFTVDTPPKSCESVSGDGNCLFRAFSFWITGSENHHGRIRKAIIRELKTNESRYKHLLTGPSVDSYLEETSMEQEGIWGTEAEVFVAATLLKTPVMVYASYGEMCLWQKFPPPKMYSSKNAQMRLLELERRKLMNKPLVTESTVGIYLQNSGNHFEPVIDV